MTWLRAAHWCGSWHVSLICLIRICDMTYLYVWCNSEMHDMAAGTHSCDERIVTRLTCLHVTWLVYMWHHSSHDLLTSLMWRTHMTNRSWLDWFTCDMTHLHVTWLIYMWHHSSRDLLTSLMWRSHVTNRSWLDWVTCDMTRLYVTSLVTCFVDITYVTHSYNEEIVTRLVCMSHDLFTCDMTRLYVTSLVTGFVDITYVTLSCDKQIVTRLGYMWHDSFICDITRHVFRWHHLCDALI